MAKKKAGDSDEEEDNIFYYRFCSSSTSNQTQNHNNNKNKSSGSGGGGGGGGGVLAPSKSTLYVSNLDYSLTNCDLHTLFSTFGKIARVTVLKDRATRRSRGVAFVQFVSRHDALRAASEMHRKILNGRTLSASIAADNGRAPEFIKKRVYRDTGRCYECGESGHLSYECPKNQLGPRDRPAPKRSRRGRSGGGGGGRGFRRTEEEEEEDGGGDDDGLDGGDRFEDDNWASVVDNGADERLMRREEKVVAKKKMKMKKNGYFSDESDDDDE